MKLIPVAQPSIDADELRLVASCLKSTWISSSGKYIEYFEHEFAQKLKVPYAISCTNGTTALHLALLALGIGPSDEVILPAFSFVAIANAVRYVGATPVFVDIDPETWNINSQKIESKINSKTRAILPVHSYGYPAEMTNILRLSQKYNLFVVEDAAEAHFAKYKDRFVGTFGDVGCFSFYGNKIITTGEGGMVVTSKKTIAERVRLLKNHGMSQTKKYYHPIIGYNYRMTNIQAAIGIAQLGKLEKILTKRKKIAFTYHQLLRDVPGLVFQPVLKSVNEVCWLFSFLVTKKYGRTRDELIKHLKSSGIDSRPFFYPITSFPMYKTREYFGISQMVSRQGISLPSYHNLNLKQQFYISQIIKNFASYK